MNYLVMTDTFQRGPENLTKLLTTLHGKMGDMARWANLGGVFESQFSKALPVVERIAFDRVVEASQSTGSFFQAPAILTYVLGKLLSAMRSQTYAVAAIWGCKILVHLLKKIMFENYGFMTDFAKFFMIGALRHGLEWQLGVSIPTTFLGYLPALASDMIIFSGIRSMFEILQSGLEALCARLTRAPVSMVPGLMSTPQRGKIMGLLMMMATLGTVALGLVTAMYTIAYYVFRAGQQLKSMQKVDVAVIHEEFHQNKATAEAGIPAEDRKAVKTGLSSIHDASVGTLETSVKTEPVAEEPLIRRTTGSVRRRRR